MDNNYHERFLSIIKDMKMDRFPTFVGTHFNPSEYADLLDMACSRLYYYYELGDKPMVIRYIQFIEHIRTRKMQRYYNGELYELLKNG